MRESNRSMFFSYQQTFHGDFLKIPTSANNEPFTVTFLKFLYQRCSESIHFLLFKMDLSASIVVWFWLN